MKTRSFFITIAVGTIIAAVAATGALPLTAANAASQPRDRIQQAFTHAIPNVAGKTITGIVVTYAPGQASVPHRHGTAFVVGYVLSGAIRSQVDDGVARVFHAGESWTEAPGAHHMISENASKTEPASLLALFVADSGESDLVKYDPPE